MVKMKKFLFLAVIIIVLYSVSVNAAASVASISPLSLGTVALGGSAVGFFTLTNNGNVALNNVKFTFSDSDFSLTFNKTGFSLANGASENINFTISIPSITSTGNITLGSVNLVSTELNQTPLFSVKADVVGGLIIEDLDVSLTTRIKYRSDGTLKSGSASDLDVQDGKKLDFGEEDVGPGSELKFNFNIENTFRENDDIDIEDVTVIVTIESIDDGQDIDEESEEFDVDSAKSLDVDVFIDIPLSVAEGAYDVVIEAEGKDTNGNTHTATMNLEMTAKKEQRDVIVTQASLFPEKVICGGTSTLTATIKNLGTKIEEDAGIEITNSDLGINSIQKRIELDEDPFDPDNELTKSLTINTDKAKTKSGTYPIAVRAYLQEGIAWETRTVNLEVEGCSNATIADETVEEAEPTEEQAKETETMTQSEEKPEEIKEKGVKVPVLKPETTIEVPLTKRAGFWAAFVLANIIVIGSIAYLAVHLYGKKPQ